MTTLNEIIEQDHTWVCNSNISIHVETNMGTVWIRDNDSLDIFLQGDDGYCFIDEARHLWDSLGNVTMGEVYAHLARPYIECMS